MQRTRHLLADLGLVLLALAVAAGCVWVVTRQQDATGDSVAAAAPPPRVAMLTAELGSSVEGGRSAAELAAAELGLDLDLIDAAGSGFATADAGLPNLGGLVEQRLEEGGYDVVVVQGGAGDGAVGIGTVGAAAGGVIDRIRERVPLSTRLVLVGPVSAGADPTGVAAVREALRAVASRQRVHFLDPIAAGWVDAPAVDAPLSAEQQRQAGRRLAEELRELGIVAV